MLGLIGGSVSEGESGMVFWSATQLSRMYEEFASRPPDLYEILHYRTRVADVSYAFGHD
jgi:hypothetical protein